MFSVSLELPEFKVVKQVFHEEFFQLNVVKNQRKSVVRIVGFLLIMSTTDVHVKYVT